MVTDVILDTANILKAMKITPKKVCYYLSASWKWQVYLKILGKTVAGEARINELMKEFAADKELKPHIQDIAALVPRVIKALTKLPSERKARLMKIKTVDEKTIIEVAASFLKDRFNAEVSIYSEEDQNRFDPKKRAVMALPYQPAIYIE